MKTQLPVEDHVVSDSVVEEGLHHVVEEAEDAGVVDDVDPPHPQRNEPDMKPELGPQYATVCIFSIFIYRFKKGLVFSGSLALQELLESISCNDSSI